MGEAVIVAIISGLLTLLGTIITVLESTKKTTESFKVHQAVTDEKIETLTREVRKHNGFAEKIPVLEERIAAVVKRVDDLEDDRK